MKQTKTIHASRMGTKRPLCDKRQGKVTDDPAEVNCTACGRAAQRVVEAMEEAAAREAAASLEGRQAAALAASQGPRWWETEQKLHTHG